MKRFLLSVVLATTLALTSCQFDDSDIWNKFGEMEESIRDHEQRISALEELCKQMNTNIEALQTLVNALEKRDYVTNVSEVRSNGEVIGYTISFAYSDTITIYHGQDGKDGANGADGKDGYTPQIGVMKDVDGIYYWTLDGEWLLDAKGNKIQANGVNGTDGTNGSNGTNGTNGVTPQLKIENDYWYVSYDNGATWEKLGKATGDDGIDGENGEDGDSIFKSVTQDDEYVYFNLSDGTMITLPKHDKENIQFEDLQVKAICCKNWDTNNDGELSYAEAAAVTDIGDVFSGNANIIAFTEFKYFTGISEIPESAFEGCSALWKIVLPDSIQTIETSAFYSCTTLCKINLPKNIIFIGAKAFERCNSINGIEIPEGLMSIGDYAFKGCNSLSILDMPKTVIEIGTQSFYGCDGLQSTTIPNSVTMIGAEAFYGCTGELKINCNLPDQSTSKTPLCYSKFSNIIIGDNVKSIGAYYFTLCSYATKITIPDSVTSIGVHAFNACSKLSEVTIPKNVKHIGGWAFSGCSSLTNVFCKPEMPTETDFSSSGEDYIFPFNKNLKIYIPRNSYYLYINYKPQFSSSFGWAEYKNYYIPYDFE